MDGGEAIGVVGGEPVTVAVFLMRLCYSRKLFVTAYPRQAEEARALVSETDEVHQACANARHRLDALAVERDKRNRSPPARDRSTLEDVREDTLVPSSLTNRASEREHIAGDGQ